MYWNVLPNRNIYYRKTLPGPPPPTAHHARAYDIARRIGKHRFYPFCPHPPTAVARFTAPPNMVNSAVHTGTEAMSHLAIKNHGSWVWVSPVRAFFPKPLRRTDLTRLPLCLAAWRRNGCPIQRLLAAGYLMPGVNGSGVGWIDRSVLVQHNQFAPGESRSVWSRRTSRFVELCDPAPKGGRGVGTHS